jgi:hypothetical protein
VFSFFRIFGNEAYPQQGPGESPAGTLGRVSGPLANSYQMELEPPLGLPVNSSPETSCSLPIEGCMALSLSSFLWKGDEEANIKKSRHFPNVLPPCAEARVLPLHPCCSRIVGKLWQPNAEIWGLPLHLGHGQVTNKGKVNDIYGGKYKDFK